MRPRGRRRGRAACSGSRGGPPPPAPAAAAASRTRPRRRPVVVVGPARSRCAAARTPERGQVGEHPLDPFVLAGPEPFDQAERSGRCRSAAMGCVVPLRGCSPDGSACQTASLRSASSAPASSTRSTAACPSSQAASSARPSSSATRGSEAEHAAGEGDVGEAVADVAHAVLAGDLRLDVVASERCGQPLGDLADR